MSQSIALTALTNFYAPWSFWNTPIPTDATVDANSASMVATALTPYASSANFANTNDWGISAVTASASDPTYTLSNPQYYNNGPATVHIPVGAQPSTGSDHHLVVLQPDGSELDMWDAIYNASNGTWSAGSYFIVNPNGWGAAAAPGAKAGSAVASGFSELGGIVTPQQIASGSIDHALSLMIPLTLANKITGAATETDGRSTQAGAIPEGAHIQLDPSFNVAAQNWPTWEKEIAIALQKYGAYVSDTGGSLAFYGENDLNTGATQWSSTGTPDGASLASLPWNDMRVLTLATSPVVTGVTDTPSSGSITTGQTVTINLAFSKAVQVIGQPSLALNDGGVADYVSGSGTGTLSFAYTVAAGQTTQALAISGVNVSSSAYVTDAAGNAADFGPAITTLPGNLSVVASGTTQPPTPPSTVSPDHLSLVLSEDAWRGNAQFIVTVDGTTIGGPTAVTALHRSGQTQTFDYTGAWGSGTHTIAVDFVNDAYGGGSKDRNLYVNDVLVNGQSYSHGLTGLYSNGSVSFHVTTPS